MKIKSMVESVVFVAFTTALLVGCAPKNGVSAAGNGATATNIDAIESAYMLPLPSSPQDDASCITCDTKPGDIAAFKAALADSKVQRYTDGGTTKVEHKVAETFCDPAFFYTCTGKMVLQATDGKSDRVELRQEKNLSLNQSSSMRLQAQFENLPNASATKGVTLAQIHSDANGVDRPLLRIEYTGENELRAVLTDTYVKGAGTSTNDYLVAFKDGDHLYCKLEFLSKDNAVVVYVKNLTTGKSKSKTYTANSTWQSKDGDFYFKTGAYLQESGKSPKATYQLLQFTYGGN